MASSSAVARPRCGVGGPGPDRRRLPRPRLDRCRWWRSCWCSRKRVPALRTQTPRPSRPIRRLPAPLAHDLHRAVHLRLARKWPAISDDKLPIDFIIPAYNETAGIHLTLRSIDAAAVRYGGPVRVILADDGSTDGTGDLARAEMAAFRAASGIVVPGRHLGKAAALNTALSFAETHTVVRIDAADVMIDDGAFLPLAAWFGDPTDWLGRRHDLPPAGRPQLVPQDAPIRMHQRRTAASLARRSPVSTRWSASPVRSRRSCAEPSVEFGGFVTGMNGEDADLTLQLGRLGYRIIIDPRIVAFEDVPATLVEFREQRIRWNRAGTQVAFAPLALPVGRRPVPASG